MAETEAYLAALAGELTAHGFLVQTGAGMPGGASRSNCQAAAEHSAAAVVMATHGLTGLARTIMGSVAGGVLHRTACPVLLVRSIQPVMSHVEQTVGVEAVSQVSP